MVAFIAIYIAFIALITYHIRDEVDRNDNVEDEEQSGGWLSNVCL